MLLPSSLNPTQSSSSTKSAAQAPSQHRQKPSGWIHRYTLLEGNLEAHQGPGDGLLGLLGAQLLHGVVVLLLLLCHEDVLAP